MDLVGNRKTNVPPKKPGNSIETQPQIDGIAQLDVVHAAQSDVPQGPICKVVVVHVVSMGPQ